MGWEAGVLSVMPGGVGVHCNNTWELGPAAGIHFSDKSAGRTWPDTTATLMAPTLMSASYTIHHAASWGHSVGDSARQISGAEDARSVRKTRRESHKATRLCRKVPTPTPFDIGGPADIRMPKSFCRNRYDWEALQLALVGRRCVGVAAGTLALAQLQNSGQRASLRRQPAAHPMCSAVHCAPSLGVPCTATHLAPH